MSTDRHSSQVLLVLATGLTIGAPSAWADQRPGGGDRDRHGRVETASCLPGEMLPEGHPLPISTTTIATIRFPGKLTLAEAATARAGAVTVAYGADTVFLRPAPDAEPGATATIHLQGVGFDPVALSVRVEPPSVPIHAQWVMLPNGRLAAAVPTVPVDAIAKLPESEELAVINSAIRQIDIYDNYERVSIPDPDPDEQGVIVRAKYWGKTGLPRVKLLRVFVANRSDETYDLARLQVFNDRGSRDHAVAIRLQLGARSVRLDEGAVVLQPADVIDGWAWVIDPERLGQYATVAINDTPGKRPRLQDIPVYDLTPPVLPPTPEELEQQRREREARRVSLHVTGSYGAFFVAPDVEGAGTEAASLTGVGIRFTKGLFPMLAFETEIGGASSGVATFDGVTVNGSVGELTRSARLARVTVGGVLRFGDTVVPSVRAGLGLQVVDNDETFMSDGGPVEGPGAGFEAGMAVYVGGAIDVKLGSNLLLGTSLSFTQSDQRILDLGVNLAYRWDPSE